MSCLSVFFVALKTNIYPAIRNFYFIPFFISFRFTTQITWYNDLFISEYLASAIPFVTKNISSVTFFILFENKSVSSLNLTALFYIFLKCFASYCFLFCFILGLNFVLSWIFVVLLCLKNWLLPFFAFFFFPLLRLIHREFFCLLFHLFFYKPQIFKD